MTSPSEQQQFARTGATNVATPAAIQSAPRQSKVAVLPLNVPPRPTSGPPVVRQPSVDRDLVTTYIELEVEARACSTLDDLRFAIVNATRRLAPFEQAVLVEPDVKGGWAITRAASVASIDKQAPLVRALATWLAHPRNNEPLRRGEARFAKLDQERSDWGLACDPFQMPNALWLPIKSRDGHTLAALLALKREPWQQQHLTLLMPLAGAYSHAWEALLPAGGRRRDGHLPARWRRGMATVAVALAGLAAFLPVPISALAPAEIVAVKPALVTAPIDGVVADLPYPPGTYVEQGAIVVELVDVKLRNEVEVARRNVAVAEARYFRVVQSATATHKDMQDLATAKAEVEVAKADLAFASEQMSRATIKAPSSGLLIYAAKSDWIGKPVTTGERMLEIGDPDDTEVRIELPVSDSIVLAPGGKVSMFLDGDPLQVIPASITQTSYRPSLTADRQLAFKVHASFEEKRRRRIGVRGVARLDGGDVPLWFYLLRRPIATVRQRFGL